MENIDTLWPLKADCS